MFELEKVAHYFQITAKDFQTNREVYALFGLREVEEQFVGVNITKEQLRHRALSRGGVSAACGKILPAAGCCTRLTQGAATLEDGQKIALTTNCRKNTT